MAAAMRAEVLLHVRAAGIIHLLSIFSITIYTITINIIEHENRYRRECKTDSIGRETRTQEVGS